MALKDLEMISPWQSRRLSTRGERRKSRKMPKSPLSAFVGSSGCRNSEVESANGAKRSRDDITMAEDNRTRRLSTRGERRKSPKMPKPPLSAFVGSSGCRNSEVESANGAKRSRDDITMAEDNRTRRLSTRGERRKSRKMPK